MSNNFKSTGPVTPEGKAKSAQNSVKHGCCSRSVKLLDDESMTDFYALEHSWYEGYKVDPFSFESQFEAELIRICVDADWLARRSERLYSDLEVDIMSERPRLIDWTDYDHKRIALANRYRTANRNSLTKARKALEDYRKARAAEKLQQQKLTHNEEKLTIHKEKNAPEPSFEEAIAEAREISIRLGYLNPDGTPTGKK